MGKIGMWVWIYNIILLALVTTLVGIAACLTEYTVFGNAISTLGNKELNPVGCKFFNAALWILCLGILPPLARMYTEFTLSDLCLASFVFMSAGCYLGCMLAIWDESHPKHLMLAYTTFILYGVGLLLLGIHAVRVGYDDYFIMSLLSLFTISLVTLIIMVICKRITFYHLEWIMVVELIGLYFIASGHISCPI